MAGLLLVVVGLLLVVIFTFFGMFCFGFAFLIGKLIAELPVNVDRNAFVLRVPQQLDIGQDGLEREVTTFVREVSGDAECHVWMHTEGKRRTQGENVIPVRAFKLEERPNGHAGLGVMFIFYGYQ